MKPKKHIIAHLAVSKSLRDYVALGRHGDYNVIVSASVSA